MTVPLDPASQFEADVAEQAAWLRRRGWERRKGGEWKHPVKGGYWYRWGAVDEQLRHEERMRQIRKHP